MRHFKLSTIIVIFGCIVVVVSLLVTDLLISNTTSERIRANQEEKVQIVSRTVAESEIVKESLILQEKSEAIQAYTQEVQTITEMMFVVVMDMDGIRYTHPNPDMIGEYFTGGDEQRVLQGEEYVSVSEGTLGDSLRAFTPIYDNSGNQIGAVAVGISLENVELALSQSHRNIIEGSLLGIIIGVIGAILLAKYIKRILFGLEPYEISKLLEERSTMLQSVHEGILAVDDDLRITLVNKSARQLFKKAGLPDQPIGMKITDFMPNTKLDRVIETGESERDEEQTLNGISILTNREPLVVNNKVVGAISTFRDKTEVNQLAKQLTGVRTYVEALRAQSHEFMNRLHVILGMVQMEAYDELVPFIRKIIDLNNQEAESITKSIKDPVLAGFLMGKMSYARERNVTFTITNDTWIDKALSLEISQELITIIGNLVDNAIEALSTSNEKKLTLQLKESDGKLSIDVSDSGPGISKEYLEKIFEKGFSTKGSNRGFGLYLMKQSIEKLKGEFKVSTSEKGTTFNVVVDYASMRDGIQNDD
ncbi:DcuS/MalK family sensor histidine kinase [Aquibacillus albus]|uniref:histidine kinase n=1 Tax=Aquibacillus albus TaxID=1168171 RepID=A0ABS2N1C0_9BACI|nr:DcuS/MalK family sensor histidine kinase [Aquibacillus albus]MBM7571904.1 CitB family two-component system sensor histidine kinase MalK [Aquibacillus albus]